MLQPFAHQLATHSIGFPMGLHPSNRESSIARYELVEKICRHLHLKARLQIGRVDIDGSKYVHPRDDVFSSDHLDAARCDEGLVETAELIAETAQSPSLVRSGRSDGILDHGIVRIERQPSRLVVSTCNLGRRLRRAE
jgi:hypothetical protein